MANERPDGTVPGDAETGSARARWELWRQDENGNRFRVSVHDDRAQAQAGLDAFESGVVHKQTYWIIEA